MKKSPARDAHASITKHLAEHKVELDTVEPDAKSGETHITGRVWHAAKIPGFEKLGPVNVQLPVQGRVKVSRSGKVETLALSKPSQEDIEEARSYAASLAANGDIEGVKGKSPSAGPSTHRLEEGPDGQRRLTRKGFSAM
jgi:hypothetical protein